MSFKEKFIHEVKALFWTSVYFLFWFGTLILLKNLLLKEYQIAFFGFSMVVVGALIAAKVVLIFENIPIGSWTKNKPAIFEIILRTLLYMAGAIVVLVLEKSFEARHEYGGIFNAMKALSGETEIYHIIVNVIGVFGAFFGFNLWSVLNKHLGGIGLLKILSIPVPDKQSN